MRTFPAAHRKRMWENNCPCFGSRNCNSKPGSRSLDRLPGIDYNSAGVAVSSLTETLHQQDFYRSWRIFAFSQLSHRIIKYSFFSVGIGKRMQLYHLSIVFISTTDVTDWCEITFFRSMDYNTPPNNKRPFQNTLFNEISVMRFQRAHS